LEFLGCTVGKFGVKMSPIKIQAVQTWPEPKNVKDVQAFMRFANFNQQFIPEFLKIAIPLTELIKKDKPFE
jgi:hypothetical protein